MSAEHEKDPGARRDKINRARKDVKPEDVDLAVRMHEDEGKHESTVLQHLVYERKMDLYQAIATVEAALKRIDTF